MLRSTNDYNCFSDSGIDNTSVKESSYNNAATGCFNPIKDINLLDMGEKERHLLSVFHKNRTDTIESVEKSQLDDTVTSTLSLMTGATVNDIERPNVKTMSMATLPRTPPPSRENGGSSNDDVTSFQEKTSVSMKASESRNGVHAFSPHSPSKEGEFDAAISDQRLNQRIFSKVIVYLQKIPKKSIVTSLVA